VNSGQGISMVVCKHLMHLGLRKHFVTSIITCHNFHAYFIVTNTFVKIHISLNLPLRITTSHPRTTCQKSKLRVFDVEFQRHHSLLLFLRKEQDIHSEMHVQLNMNRNIRLWPERTFVSVGKRRTHLKN